MKKVMLIVLVLVGMSLPFATFAGEWHGGKITKIYPRADGDFILIFDADDSECTSEETPDYYWVRVGENSMTQEGSEKLYAAAMTAAVSGKQVNFYFDETSTLCEINRLQIQF